MLQVIHFDHWKWLYGKFILCKCMIRREEGVVPHRVYICMCCSGSLADAIDPCSSVCRSICLSVCLSLCISVCSSVLCMFLCLLVCPYVCLSICLCVRPSVVRMFAYLSYIYKFLISFIRWSYDLFKLTFSNALLTLLYFWPIQNNAAWRKKAKYIRKTKI